MKVLSFGLGILITVAIQAPVQNTIAKDIFLESEKIPSFPSLPVGKDKTCYGGASYASDFVRAHPDVKRMEESSNAYFKRDDEEGETRTMTFNDGKVNRFYLSRCFTKDKMRGFLFVLGSPPIFSRY